MNVGGNAHLCKYSELLYGCRSARAHGNRKGGNGSHHDLRFVCFYFETDVKRQS